MCASLSISPHLAASCWLSEIHHGGSPHTSKISKRYNEGSYVCSEGRYTSIPLILIHNKFSARTQTLRNVVLGTVFRSLDGLGPFRAWLLKAYLLDGAHDANSVLVFKSSCWGSGENLLCALWSYSTLQPWAGHEANCSLDTQVEESWTWVLWSQSLSATRKTTLFS